MKKSKGLLFLILVVAMLAIVPARAIQTIQIREITLSGREMLSVICSEGMPLIGVDGPQVIVHCYVDTIPESTETPSPSPTLSPSPTPTVTPSPTPTPIPTPTREPVTDCTIEVGPQGDYSTLQGAADNTQPGDIVCVQAGTYTDDRVILSRSGIASEPIVFRAEPGVTLIGSFRLPNVDYNHIVGFEITGSTTHWCGVYIRDGSHHNLIEDNHIHHLDGASHGICIISSSYNVLRGNEIHDMFRNGILIGGGVPRYNIVEDNHCYLNTGDTKNADGIALYADAQFNVFRRNILHDNGDDGLDTWGSDHNLIYDNVSYHNGFLPGGTERVGDGNGFKLGGPGGGGNLVVGNVSYRNGATGFTTNGGPQANTLYYNVAYQNDTRGFEEWSGSGGGVLRNCIGYANDSYDCRWASDAIQDHNLCSGDPLFVAPPADFHLRPGSPAIDAGIAVTAPWPFLSAEHPQFFRDAVLEAIELDPDDIVRDLDVGVYENR